LIATIGGVACQWFGRLILRAGDDSPRRTTRGEQHRARTADKGAALVEMAFTITLLVMLLIGVVTSAIALGQDNSIENAAREASRFGATLPGGGTLIWFTDVRDVARGAATGDLDVSVPNEEICVAFIKSDDSATHVIDDGGAPSPLVVDSGSCPGFDDGRSGNNEPRVNVVTQRDSEIDAVIFSTDVTLRGQASARYEREEP
jgi:hypothetical protein